MATHRKYTYRSYWTPREIQDGAHGGDTSYEVLRHGVKIGDMCGMLIGDNWEKQFSFQHVDGRSGCGLTRVAAVEDALSRARSCCDEHRPAVSEDGCDWCFFGTVDWKGDVVPCPFCSGGPREALPCNQ